VLPTQIFADVQKRLGVHSQHLSESTLPQSTQLQLALTSLALLQLQPQAAFASLAATGASTSHAGLHVEAMTAWRHKCLLALLNSPRAALRARAGPLAAGLLMALPASAAAAAADGAQSSSNGSRPVSVTALTSAALAEIVGYIPLQSSPELTQAHEERVQQRQAAQHKAAAGALAAQKELDAVLTATNREAQQEALAWEAAVVQLADLACATTAVACVALQQQEPPDALDAQLIMLLLRHTASLQLLPDGILPTTAVDNPGSNGSARATQSGSSGHSSSGARAHAMRIAAAALEVMSHQQQYSRRYAYLHYHRRMWTKEWVAAGCTVQQLLAVQPLVGAPAGVSAHDAQQAHTSGRAGLAAAGGAAAAGITALLQAYSSSLTFWLIFHGAQEQLAALAAAAGLQEAELLQLFTLELCSCVYPMLKVPELKEGASRFTKKLNNTQTVSAHVMDIPATCNPETVTMHATRCWGMFESAGQLGNAAGQLGNG
jgi:hypothetical protein